MRITVHFNDHSALSCLEVNSSRQFWRMVSKHCKLYNVRVVKVVKEL